MQGYEGELAKARRHVSALTVMIAGDERRLEVRVRLAYRQFHLASLTEDQAEYDRVAETINSLIHDFGPIEDVCLLKANVDARFHRLDQARQDLSMCPRLIEHRSGRAILSEVDFQQGRYAEARESLATLANEERTWDVLARLAHWESKLGDADEADRLYEEAGDQLTAKELRSFAWLELQRGDLALARGRLATARAHYHRAAVAFPHDWRTDEHLAALLIAEGKPQLAEALLLSIIPRCPKPEVKQVLGELLVSRGQTEEARKWLEQAATAFLKSARQGDVHYFHHLADLYADGLPQPAEAVHWARKDIAQRSNFSTQSMLAWTLYKNGEIDEGPRWIRMALASGVRDAGIFDTAAALCRASGDEVHGAQYERAAVSVNPSRQHIHMH